MNARHKYCATSFGRTFRTACRRNGTLIVYVRNKTVTTTVCEKRRKLFYDERQKVDTPRKHEKERKMTRR